MAVVNNTCSEIGDSLLINSRLSITGAMSFTSYTDVLVGETGTRFFTKLFRVSTDGVMFTNWATLSDPNLVLISGNATGIVYFEFKYTRAGSDTTGLLEFDSITIDGSTTPYVCNSTVGINSIFSDIFCNNVVVAEICDNLLKKLYKRGILPTPIERGRGGDYDEDFIAFWKAISCFFTLFIVQTSKFENLLSRRDYLLEYVKQKGLYITEAETTLADLQYLISHLYDEVRQRGTIQIKLPKNYTYLDTTVKEVDGELLRLINYHQTRDEFLFNVCNNNSIGWCLGKSSPMYKGTYRSNQINKTPENTEDFIDITKYILVNSGLCSIATDGGKEVLSIQDVQVGDVAGIGYEYGSFPSAVSIPENESILIDPQISYELTFWIKNPGVDVEWSVYLGGYNIDGVLEVDSFINAYNTTPNDILIPNTTYFPQADYSFVRCIIYKQDNADMTITEAINPVGGHHLRFNIESIVRRIVPSIVLDNISGSAGVSNEMRIWDWKLRPLNTPYSKGFVNVNNFIDCWMQNNSHKSIEDISVITNKYLIPYNSKFNIIELVN